MTLTDEDSRQTLRLHPRAVIPGSLRTPQVAPPKHRFGTTFDGGWSRGRIGAILALLGVLFLMVTGISAYFQRVSAAPAEISYAVTAPSQGWLQPQLPGAVSYYRAEMDLRGAPTSGVLWIDARDTYRVWINDRLVTTNRTAARQGALPLGIVLDVRSFLTTGRNVVAVQVNALGDETAAMWARLAASTARGPVDLSTDGGKWLSTSQAALTGSTLGLQPDFIKAGFPVTGWTAPTLVPSLRVVHTSVPGELMVATAPTAFSVRGFDAAYTLAATVPAAESDSWLQVAGSGALTVSVNGQAVAAEPAPAYQSPNSHRTAPLQLIHLGTHLHSGVNSLVFRVTGGGTTTALAARLFTSASGSDWSPLDAAEQQWTIDAQGDSVAAVPLDARATASVWPNGFTALLSTSGALVSGWVALGWTVLPAVLLVMLVLGMVVLVGGRALGVPRTVLLGRLTLCLAPGIAVILMALAYGRWVTVEPGFPYTSPVAKAVTVTLVVPLLGLVVLTALGRVTRDRPVPTTAPKSRSSVSRMRDGWLGLVSRLPAALPPHRLAVIAIAGLATVAQGWRIGRQPLWQDEVTSLTVARAISEHGLPRLDSGLYYFKAELYHVLLALAMRVTENPDALRMIALVWFTATVLAFGLLLMPTLTSSRNLQVIATMVFVLVPAEGAWARDIRMYQQMQFFAVIFLALYIRALRSGRTRDIVGSAVALLAMYLSHEESFVLLPALPLMALAARHVVWSRKKIFALAFVPVGVVIAMQYALSHIHPPDFGEDLSNRPYVGWDPNQADYYYQKVFFAPISQAGTLAVLSTLAIVAMIVGLRRRDSATSLASIGLVVTVVSISLVLTAKVERYSFVTIPLLVALAVMGAAHLVEWLAKWRTGLDRPGGAPVRRWLRATAVATVIITVGAVTATLVTSPRGFGLWAADLTGDPNPLTHPDYAPTIGYLEEHQQPGDQVISLSPPVMTRQYLGRAPDRVIQTGRNKLLYLVLRNGQAVETILGVPVLLTGEQIRVFLEAHPRVWLVSDAGSYAKGTPPDVQDEISKDFKVVAQDATTTVSLWDEG